MQGTIRKRLQSILACIFALRIFDNGKKMAPTSKISRKQEEKPRKPKNVAKCLGFTVWKDVAGPRFFCGEHNIGKIISTTCSSSFLRVSNDCGSTNTCKAYARELFIPVSNSMYSMNLADWFVSLVFTYCATEDITSGASYNALTSMRPPSVLHNILLDHNAREWTEQDDLDVFNVPSTRDSSAAYNPTDDSYMSGSDNSIQVDECEAEGSWTTLRSRLITHYKYAKCHDLLR